MLLRFLVSLIFLHLSIFHLCEAFLDSCGPSYLSGNPTTPRSSIKGSDTGPTLLGSNHSSLFDCSVMLLHLVFTIFFQQRNVNLKRSFAFGPKCCVSLYLWLKYIFSAISLALELQSARSLSCWVSLRGELRPMQLMFVQPGRHRTGESTNQ